MRCHTVLYIHLINHSSCYIHWNTYVFVYLPWTPAFVRCHRKRLLRYASFLTGVLVRQNSLVKSLYICHVFWLRQGLHKTHVLLCVKQTLILLFYLPQILRDQHSHHETPYIPESGFQLDISSYRFFTEWVRL